MPVSGQPNNREPAYIRRNADLIVRAKMQEGEKPEEKEIKRSHLVQNSQTDSNSVAKKRKYNRKRKPRKETEKRHNIQELRREYAITRENAQLAGIIPVTPEGAVRDERVDTRLQGCQQLPKLVQQALRDNWSVPDIAKAAIIGSLLQPFYTQDTIVDANGNTVVVPPNRALLMELAKTLKMLDNVQYERDNPELAARAKGGNVSVQTNIAAATIIRELIEKEDIL